MPSTPKANWEPVKDLQGQNGEPLFLNKDTRQLVTAAGVNVMNPTAVKKAPGAEEDKARYIQLQTDAQLGKVLSPEDRAWADNYAKEKLLTVDRSAAAAADRQASAQGQQNALQQQAQTFQVQQAGRKELTDKVVTPFNTAQSAAQELRDVVDAAKAGNKIAGSQQNLLATVASIRSQGLNRINQTEVGVTAGAGTLWDHLNGRLGKATAGQPEPPDVQADMLKYADLLEKNAYQKYVAGHQDITKRYGLTETPLPPPPSVAPPTTPALSPGLQGLLNRP